MQGRFIATVAAAAIAALAIGPAAALAAPGSFVDDAASDFSAGTPGSATSVVAPGSVQLQRTLVDTPFGADPGGALPTGLTSTQWTNGEGSATVSPAGLTVSGVRVNENPDHLYGPGQVMQFGATFSNDPFQHVGFGQTFDDGQPLAIFTTSNDAAGGAVFARTVAPTAPEQLTMVAPAGHVVAPHTYRIEWSATEVKYYVDNSAQPVATHTLAIADKMRPIASDLRASDGSLALQSFGMMRYGATGAFTSAVRDAGGSKVTWGAFTSSATAPAGTSISFETRSGNTPAPDATWSNYQPVIGGAIASPGARYIQYRATLNSTDNGVTPSLDSVRIAYDLDTSTPATGGGSQGGGQTAGGGSSSGGNSSFDRSAPKVTLVAKSLRASRNGTVSFTVGCPATESSCQVTLKLKNGSKTLASKTVTVKGGKTKTVTLQLNKATRQELKHRSLKVSTVVSATDAAGNKRTSTKKVTLRKS